MSNEQKPSVGRVVHYVSGRSGNHLAAIIAFVNEDGTVNLGAFDEFGGHMQRRHVPYDASAKVAGSWHWPERVQ